MSKISIVTKVLAGTALALSMGAANAITINFYNGAALYATLTTSGSTDFDLYFVGTGNSGAKFNDLIMEGPSGTFTNNTNAAVTTPTGTYWANHYGGSLNYDWSISFPTSSGPSLFTAGEHAYFSITTTDSSVWISDQIHINAFDGTQSIKLSGCIAGTQGCGGQQVPEPGTLALLGLGLLGLGAARRKTA